MLSSNLDNYSAQTRERAACKSMKIDQIFSPFHDENTVDSRARYMCFVLCPFQCVHCVKSEFSQFSIFIKFVKTVRSSSTEKYFFGNILLNLCQLVIARTKI